MRKWQIGVMGSQANLNYTKEVEEAAEKIGMLLAQRGAIVLYGAEKDTDSLSTAAARGAKRAGGLTIGVTYGRGKEIWDTEETTDVVIVSGLERGGGREFVMVSSCDAIIAIAGGSGTLNELAIAYQLDIPMVALSGYGGWSEKMADTYFDGRNRRKILKATTPEEAVDLAFRQLTDSSFGR